MLQVRYLIEEVKIVLVTRNDTKSEWYCYYRGTIKYLSNFNCIIIVRIRERKQKMFVSLFQKIAAIRAQSQSTSFVARFYQFTFAEIFTWN